jgi:hypothetical protein
MLQATRVLTSAEIQALDTTPVQIIPSPGPAKTITILALVIKLNFATTPYYAPASGPFLLYLDPALLVTQDYWAGLIDQSADTLNVFQANYLNLYSNQTKTTYADKPLMLTTPTAQAPSGGDGTATITAYYAITAID